MNIRCDRSGIILVVVLVVVSILMVFAFSAGALTSTISRYTQKEFSRTRALASAMAGVYYTLNLMRQHPSSIDFPWQSGVATESVEQGRKLLSNVVLDENVRFDVTIIDQARCFNLNALNETSGNVLAGLIKQYGFPAKQAEQIVHNAIQWVRETKKAPFDDVAELLMVDGMTQEIFDKIHTDLTVYPAEDGSGFKVNFWTASEPLLRALLEDLAVNRKNEDLTDIENIASKYRKYEVSAKPDAIELAKMATAGHVPAATDYRIHVVGIEGHENACVGLDAYVSKDPNAGWHIVRLERSLN